MKRAVLIALFAAAAGLPDSARADVWQEAIRGGPEPGRELYEKHLRDGDDHVTMADSRNISRTEIVRQVNLAVAAYRAAAKARPDAGEPWFRIATTLNSFYLASCAEAGLGQRSPLRDCSGPPGAINRQVAEQVVTAWQEFEKRAPLDPRLSPAADPQWGDSPLFERAILHTKLGTKPHIEEAVRLYELAIRRGSSAEANETTWSNLAETYMMLGRLDDAIEAYKQIKTAVDMSTMYGAAVVLDRAGRHDKALDIIRAQGRDSYDRFIERVQRGATFFVPYEETFYYFGLIEEAFGNYARAIEFFQMFIRSGAHPMYQPRAREHIEALVKKSPKEPPKPILYRDFR